MVTGCPKKVESPSLERFQRCADVSAVATTKKKKDMVRVTCIFNILQWLQFFLKKCSQKGPTVPHKDGENSDHSIQKLSRIRHSGKPSLGNAECGLRAMCENNLGSWRFACFWATARKAHVHRTQTLGILTVLTAAPWNSSCCWNTIPGEQSQATSARGLLSSFLFWHKEHASCSSLLGIWSHRLLLALRHSCHLLLQMAHSCKF